MPRTQIASGQEMGNDGKESAVVSTRWIVVRNVGENGWTTEENFEVRGAVEHRTTRFVIVAVEIIVRNVASQSAGRNVTIGWIGGSREEPQLYEPGRDQGLRSFTGA